MGTGTVAEAFRNTAIHEALHTYLRSSLWSGGEHELGKIDFYNSITPMAAGYADEEPRGECNQAAVRLGYTTDLTQCTKDKVKATAEEVV